MIAPACHDTASAVAAVPADGGEATGATSAPARGRSWASSSTEPIINEKIAAATTTPTRAASAGRSGSSRTSWACGSCRSAAGSGCSEGHDHSYAELTQMAERRQAVRRGHRPGPQAVPLARRDAAEDRRSSARDTKQRPPSTRGEFVRTCLESLALTYRRTLEGLEDMLGRKIEVIHIVGGGTQNELLNQMTADACDRDGGRRPGRGDGDRQHPGAGDGDGRREVAGRRAGGRARQLRRQALRAAASRSRGTRRMRRYREARLGERVTMS